MADVDMGGGDKSPGFIKLFGTFIVANKNPSKKRSSSAATVVACPRCKSRETRFCYFNNYNVNQPRHFCKVCRRYWTAGGTLRNGRRSSGGRRRLFKRAAGDGGSCGGGEEVDFFS